MSTNEKTAGIRLVPEGIEKTEWVVPDEDYLEPHYESEIIRPRAAGELLRFWHSMLQGISKDYTLGHFFNLLRGLDAEAIELVGDLCQCNLQAFLDDALQPPNPDEPNDVEYLEVYNVADLNEYVEDPSNPDERRDSLYLSEEEAEVEDAITELTTPPEAKKPWTIIDATSDDPITGKPMRKRLRLHKMNGRWVGYHLYQGFHGWGKWGEPYEGAIERDGWDPETRGGISVSMTSIADLVHLPLRYNNRIAFSTQKFGAREGVVLEDTLTITLGNFIYAILDDISFYGAPERRDAFREELDERCEALRKVEEE